MRKGEHVVGETTDTTEAQPRSHDSNIILQTQRHILSKETVRDCVSAHLASRIDKLTNPGDLNGISIESAEEEVPSLDANACDYHSPRICPARVSAAHFPSHVCCKYFNLLPEIP